MYFILTAAGSYVTYTESLRGQEKSLPGGNITGYNATEFLPPLPGVLKDGPPHYMVKNGNHPRGSSDSLNEAF